MSGLAFVFVFVIVSKQAIAMVYPKGPGCGALLTDRIVNKTISVLGSFNSSFDESHALLNNSNAWCSYDLDRLQYLRIDLDKPADISGFEVQGRSSSDQYVTKFRIRYTANDDQSQPQFYAKAFQMAPTSGDEIIRFSINNTQMKAVLFSPEEWNKHICLRVELYGCVPVDGGYTPWSDWSYCSNSCGNGKKVRYRNCSNPTPANNGQKCQGEPIQAVNCVGTFCPVNGGFSEWSNWTRCDGQEGCGTGYQLRTRRCTNPTPDYGGRNCEGTLAEGRTCQLKKCEADQPSVSSRTSDDKNDDDKFFIPLVVVAAVFGLCIVIVIGVGCVMYK